MAIGTASQSYCDIVAVQGLPNHHEITLSTSGKDNQSEIRKSGL
jgi:hypothetical protein